MPRDPRQAGKVFLIYWAINNAEAHQICPLIDLKEFDPLKLGSEVVKEKILPMKLASLLEKSEAVKPC